MISAHIFVDSVKIWSTRLIECPRVGDTLRYGGPDKYAKVTEVIWCLNEAAENGRFGPHECMRVNIRAEEIKP